MDALHLYVEIKKERNEALNEPDWGDIVVYEQLTHFLEQVGSAAHQDAT